MKTAIIFSSKYGTTNKVSIEIVQFFKNDDVELVNLAIKNNFFDLKKFDRVILGTSVYARIPMKEMSIFCNENLDFLKQVELGLFICGMAPSAEKRQEDLDNAYPEELQKYAKAKAFLGCEFKFEQMNLSDKAMVEEVAKINQSVSNIDYEAIQAFANEMQE